MDTSFFAGGPVTWAALVAFAFFVVALLKGFDSVESRLRTREMTAVSPITIDMSAVKIQVASQAEQLNAFEVEVVRTYVTGDVIKLLDRRIDDMMWSVWEEKKATRRRCCRRTSIGGHRADDHLA